MLVLLAAGGKFGGEADAEVVDEGVEGVESFDDSILLLFRGNRYRDLGQALPGESLDLRPCDVAFLL